MGDDVAWGDEVDGLQAGLSASARTCCHGETVKLAVKLRNVGKADVKFTHGLLREYAPEVTAPGGAPASVFMPLRLGIKVGLEERVLKPGETITLYHPEVAVESEDRARLLGEIRAGATQIVGAPGKYRIAYGRLIQSHPTLATGDVELEVKDPIVWGKEVDGLQAGVVGPGSVRIGETARFAVRLRNVGKADVKVTHGLLQEHPPDVAGAGGERVRVAMPPLLGVIVIPTERVLKPGETISLYTPEVAASERLIGQIGPEPLVGTPTVRVAPGTYTIAYAGMIQSHPTLATGAAEFAVKDAEPAAEPFIAWGKEAGGLQAGLEVKERRAYRLGETVTLAVRVRNVGKAVVEFAYIKQYLDENPPTVTGANGKPIRQGRTSVTGLIHLPVEGKVDPGKEVVLETRIHGAAGQPYELRPADGGGKPATRSHPLHVGTGKITLQYERVFGDTSIGRLEVDPALAELATGKLELVVTDAPPVAAGHRFTVVVDKAEPVFRAARCAFLDNDRILVQPGSELQVRDATSGKVSRSVSLDKRVLGDFRLSVNRKWVAAEAQYEFDPGFTGRPTQEHDVTVWDTATWKLRGTIDGCRRLLDVGPDGRTVAVLRETGIEVWDVVEKKRLKAAPFAFTRIDAAALSPDGTVLVVSGLNEIAYWKWRDGDTYERIKAGRKVDALVFSPGGKLVAEGPDSRRTVEVRDAATRKVAYELSDSARPRVPQTVAGVTFTDSGKTLVFVNRVGLIETIPVPHRIHFWDVKSGELTLQIDLKGGVPSSLDVSPDGKTLAALTADGGVSLRVFDLNRGGGR
jgi:hypothetical protein